MSDYHYNPNYIHHKNTLGGTTLRELVFGIEDGMVSTMGAITGIAAGTGNHSIVVLSGLVIIAVESISMGVGSYISNKSEAEMKKRMLHEEKEEIQDHPQEELDEMRRLFVQDGWTEELAQKMAKETGQNKDLMLREMAYRELHLIPGENDTVIKQGFVMWISYIFGGVIPLAPYIFLSIGTAVPVSIGITLAGLFILGVFTSRFSMRSWWKSGLEMLLLAGTAAAVGYAVGHLGEGLLTK